MPDPGDLHVVATAIRGRASQIVTFNLKDFPKSALKPHGLAAIHPDEFILERIAIDPKKIFGAFKSQVQSLKNPPKTHQQVILTLENCGLKKVGQWLQAAIATAWSAIDPLLPRIHGIGTKQNSIAAMSQAGHRMPKMTTALRPKMV